MQPFLEFLAQKWKILVFLLFLFCSAAILGRFAVTHSVIGGDGVYYYSIMHTLVIDHSVNMKNSTDHFYNEKSGFTGNRKLNDLPRPTKKGVIAINYPVGFPLLSIPFFALGHLASLALHHFKPSVSTDGFGLLPQLFTAIGSLLYGILALIAIFRFGRKHYSAVSAILAAIFTCLATPMIYYMTMEPMLSHNVAIFCISLFLIIWYHYRNEMKIGHWALLGFLGGLTALTRYQDALVVLIPPLYALIRAVKNRSLRDLQIPGGLLFAGIFASVFSIQIFINYACYGSLFTTGYAANGEGFTYWNRPFILYTLFSPYCGLITRSPIVILSFIGMGFLFRREKAATVLLLGYCILEIYLVSAWHIPSQGDTFGNRMLLNCVFIYVLGLMEYFERVKENKFWLPASFSLAALFTIANLILVPLYCFRIIGNTYAR